MLGRAGAGRAPYAWCWQLRTHMHQVRTRSSSARWRPPCQHSHISASPRVTCSSTGRMGGERRQCNTCQQAAPHNTHSRRCTWLLITAPRATPAPASLWQPSPPSWRFTARLAARETSFCRHSGSTGDFVHISLADILAAYSSANLSE